MARKPRKQRPAARSHRWPMLLLRAVYLAGILLFAALGQWGAVLFHGAIFVGSLFVPLLGRRDDAFNTFDTLIMLVFSLSLIPSYLGVWPQPETILQTMLGFDKLFHMVGGACLAIFAAIVLRKHTRDRLVFYAGIIIFALALGAAWEFFEWVASILPDAYRIGSGGYADSMLDLVADTLGAAVVALLLRVRRFL